MYPAFAANAFLSIEDCMKPLRVLHVSDLHFSPSVTDQSVLLDAFFAEVCRHKELDLVFFTGDIIAKGAYSPDTISAVRARFFDRLLKATGLPSDRLFL